MWFINYNVVSINLAWVLHFDTHVVGVNHGSLVYNCGTRFFLYWTNNDHLHSIVSTNTVIVMDLILRNKTNIQKQSHNLQVHKLELLLKAQTLVISRSELDTKMAFGNFPKFACHINHGIQLICYIINNGMPISKIVISL